MSKSLTKNTKIKENLELNITRLNEDNKKDILLRAPVATTLDELVQCSICLDTFSDPRMLQCQHTFCLLCLKFILNKKTFSTSLENSVGKPEKLLCPICESEVLLVNGWKDLETLPKNLHIDSLLNFIKNSGNVSPTVRTPFSTEKICVTCQNVCNNLTDICQHCNQIFCKVCWSGHVKLLTSKTATLIKKLEDSQLSLNHKLEDLEGKCKLLKDNIKAATEAKLLEIKVKEKQLIDEVTEIAKQGNNTFFELINNISKIKEEENKFNFLRAENDKQKFSECLKFHNNTVKLLEEVLHFGELKTYFDSENLKLDKHIEENSNEVDDENETYGIVNNPLENLQSLFKFYRTHKFVPKLVWKKCPRPTGLGIPPWAKRHLYIAASDTKMVSVLDMETNKVVGHLTSDEMLCPRSLAFSERRKEIFVVDKWKHCIHVFSSTGEYLRTLSGRGTGEGKLLSPEGLTIGQNDELIVCDTGNNRIIILDPDKGIQMGTIGVVDKKTEFNAPTSVIYFDGKIIVADCGNNRIKVFTTKGEKTLEFGSMGKNKAQFRSPEVVTVDPMGFIVVGDSGNRRVQVFNFDGELIRVFGGFGNNPGKFVWISGLVVSPQMDFVVSDHKNKSVQIL